VIGSYGGTPNLKGWLEIGTHSKIKNFKHFEDIEDEIFIKLA
jgi:hypothetical protein